MGKPAAPTSAVGLSGTPARLRLLSLVCLAVVIAAGAFAWLLTDRLVDETITIDESTGPVLITNQSILASLAEADAAAAAVHLAGAEGNPEQQRVFESALERANVGLEDVARVVGDDEASHEILARVGSSITTYAALVEGARVKSAAGLPGASQSLNEAIALLRDEISLDVAAVTAESQSQLEQNITAPYFLFAVLAIAIALLILLVAQFWMTRKFSRLINPPLLLASVALIALIILMGSSFLTQQDALDDAQAGGYEAIQITADIQSAAFQYRALQTASVINGRAQDLTELEIDLAATEVDALQVLNARTGASDGVGLLYDAAREADSPREQAAAAEMLERWARYVATSRDLDARTFTNDFEGAAEIVRGSSNDAFTGFNTSVEAALFDNRAQFSGAVDAARNALQNLRLAIAIATILAALLTWWGFTLRLQEYR